MSEELIELLRLKMKAHSVYGIGNLSKEERERQINAYKEYMETRNKFINRSRTNNDTRTNPAEC